MRPTKSVIPAIIAVIASQVWCAFAYGTGSAASDPPGVQELIDTYDGVLARCRSCIFERQTGGIDETDGTVTLPNGQTVPRHQIAPEIEECGTDGNRYCSRTTRGTAYQGSPNVTFIPDDVATTVRLWDGHYRYLYGKHSELYARRRAEEQVQPERRETYIRTMVGNLDLYVNPEDAVVKEWVENGRPSLPDYGRLRHYFAQGKDIVVHEQTEAVNGSPCSVVDLRMDTDRDKRRIRLWLDPAHGYLAAKETSWLDGDTFYEQWGAKFKLFDGVWFTAERQYRYLSVFVSSDGDSAPGRYRLNHFVLNPDHDQLRSFDPSFAEGAVTRVFVGARQSLRQRFTWRDGELIDAEGNAHSPDEFAPLPPLLDSPLPSLEGLGLAEGKPVLLAFWDMEQRPCRQAVLTLKEKAQSLAEAGVFVLLVHTGAPDQEQIAAWLGTSQVAFEHVSPKGQAEDLRRQWRIKSLPWLILTDRKHVVRAEGFAADDVEARIAEIVYSADSPSDAEPVTGLVTDPQGRPAPDVRVTEFHADKMYITGTDGTFVSAYGPSEERRFFFAVDKQRQMVGVGRLAPGQRQVEIESGPARIVSGRVVDPEGRPVAGVQVAPLPMTSFYVLTDEQGRFDVGWQAEWAGDLDEFYLMARHLERNLATLKGIDSTMQTVEIKLAAALTLTGTVEEPNGVPISGANVHLSLRKGWSCGTPVKNVVTNAAGRYEFAALPQNQEYINFANAEGFWQNGITTGIINTATDRAEAGTIILKRPNRSVSGIVVDNTGSPVPNCSVGVRGGGQPQRQGETDAQGRFTLKEICSGPIEIWGKLDGVLFGTVETEAGQENVRLVVSPIP